MRTIFGCGLPLLLVVVACGGEGDETTMGASPAEPGIADPSMPQPMDGTSDPSAAPGSSGAAMLGQPDGDGLGAEDPAPNDTATGPGSADPIGDADDVEPGATDPQTTDPVTMDDDPMPPDPETDSDPEEDATDPNEDPSDDPEATDDAPVDTDPETVEDPMEDDAMPDDGVDEDPPVDADPSAPDPAVETLSFVEDIWPIYEMPREFVYLTGEVFNGCADVGVCHGGDRPGAQLSMADPETAYEQLFEVPSVSSLCDGTVRIVPGNPDESCLILFYEGRLYDELDWVTPEEIDLMREWIAQGAAY